MLSSGELSGIEVPFVVYAVDGPSYPGFDELTYGRSRLLPEVRGSLVVLSGGYFAPGAADEESPEIFMYGCMDMWGRTGSRFAERSIAALVAADERVMLLYYVSRIQAAEWMDTVRAVGFEVIETGDVTPGYDSSFAVCIGTGNMLREYEWLKEVLGYDQFCLLACRGSQGHLEREMIRAVRARENPVDVAAANLAEVDQNPGALLDVMGDFSLFAWFTDPDLRSMKIHRRATQVGCLSAELRSIAADLGIRLYCAGSLRIPDGDGRFFTDFASWDTWQRLPRHWRRMT